MSEGIDSSPRSWAAEKLLHLLPVPLAGGTGEAAEPPSLWPSHASQDLTLARNMGRGTSSPYVAPGLVASQLQRLEGQSSTARLGWLLAQSALPEPPQVSSRHQQLSDAAVGNANEGNSSIMSAAPSHAAQLAALQLLYVFKCQETPT